MNAKEIIEFFDVAEEASKSEFVGMNGVSETIIEIGEFLNDKGEDAKRVLLEKFSEEGFVKLVRMAHSVLLTSMMAEGKGMSIALAQMAKDLEPYTHTMILNILGVLMDEEVF